MFNRLRKIKWLPLIITVVLIFNVFLVYFIALMSKSVVATTAILNTKIDIYKSYQAQQLLSITWMLNKITEYNQDNDKKILELVESHKNDSKKYRQEEKKKRDILVSKINEKNRKYVRKQETNIEFLHRNIKKNTSKLDYYKNLIKLQIKELSSIDLPNIENIKIANFVILNATLGRKSSGTHIKIKDKYYVLTASHLIKKETDILVAIDNNDTQYRLRLVKRNKEVDLALFEILGSSLLATLEISPIAPKAGSLLTVIGNPSGLVDIVTNGIISKVEATDYMITNKIFYGNSGGAVLYRGKIVGVIKSIRCIFGIPTVSYGISAKLEQLQEFLREYVK